MARRNYASLKEEALVLVHGGATHIEAAHTLGVDPKTVKNWIAKASLASDASDAGAPSREAPDTPTIETREESTDGVLDFEPSPAPIVEQSIVERGMASLKKMLGIADTPKTQATPPQTPLSGKLNAKQQNFVDATTPTLALLFMTLATWLWGRIGSEYVALAPSDAVASQIVKPILRIWARHQTFLVEINPDMADVGASLLALVAYVHVSLRAYQEIKEDIEYGHSDTYTDERNGLPYTRAYRGGGQPATNGANAPQQQSSTGDTGDRPAHVPGRGRGNAHPAHGNAGHAAPLGGNDITDAEQRQHQALLRLSEMDYLHRARRSGRL